MQRKLRWEEGGRARRSEDYNPPRFFHDMTDAGVSSFASEDIQDSELLYLGPSQVLGNGLALDLYERFLDREIESPVAYNKHLLDIDIVHSDSMPITLDVPESVINKAPLATLVGPNDELIEVAPDYDVADSNEVELEHYVLEEIEDHLPEPIDRGLIETETKDAYVVANAYVRYALQIERTGGDLFGEYGGTELSGSISALHILDKENDGNVISFYLAKDQASKT